MSDLARQSVSPRLVVLAWVAVPIAWPAVAHAQVPTLDGHRYVPSSLVAWSFVDTEVSATSEAGVTDFVIQPDFPQLTPLVSLPRQVDGRYITAAQTTAASLAIVDCFSLNIALSAAGILPRDGVSALVVGGNAFLGENVGAALRLVRSGPFQLTVRADFTALEVESVIPARVPSAIRVTGDVFGVRPTVAAALTLAPRLGLQGSVIVNWQHYDVDLPDDVTSLAGALAATLSLDPVPMTLLVGANVTHEYGLDISTATAEAVFGPDRTDWNVEGGLYFTMRSELDLGLLFRAEVAGGDNNDRFHGLFRLGYYF